MRRRLLPLSLGLLLVMFLTLPASALDSKSAMTPIDNPQSLQAPSLRAPCTMSRTNGTATSYYRSYQAGTGSYTYYNPEEMCGAPAYPFEITDFSFVLYDAGSFPWPASVELVVYDMSTDSCAGPAAELCRYPISADQATYGYPTVGTFTLPTPCCITGPVYIGLEYPEGDTATNPSVLFDDQQGTLVDSCLHWQLASDGLFYEWFDFWTPPNPGNPIFYVNGETESANCTTCEWNPGDPYKMHYPQLPDEAGWDVNATQPLVLAEDFLCTQTGWIKDIHFWGSWKDGVEGQILYFVLSFHADIPADQNPDGYSKPGETLWEREIAVFDFTPRDPPTQEGWYDPATGEALPNNHQAYFQYDICLDEPDWFMQQEGTIYWLNVSAVIQDPAATQWGWKSTLDHWNDDAVWATWGNLNWQELYEPGGFPYIPGDVNGDGVVDVNDVTALTNYLFSGTPPTSWTPDGVFYPACDVNGDCIVNNVDLAMLTQYVNTGTPIPTYCPTYPPGSAIYSQFWVGLDPAGNLIPTLSGGLWPFGAGWYYYPEVEPPFNNIWFYDHPFDPLRKKTAHIEFDLFPYEPGESYLVFVVNYTTDLFPAGNEEPPLPGSDPTWTGRDTLAIFQGEQGHFTYDWELPDYNPEWVSIDVFGFNYMIPEGSGYIIHDCVGSMDLSFVITTEEVTGACCYDPTGLGINSVCTITTQSDCVNNLLGVYEGDGTTCAGTEACCLPDGSCLDADALCCVNELGGTPQGPGTSCTATEACCLPDGTCQMLDPLCCVDQGGSPQGAGTQCTAAEACCLTNGTCTMLDPLCCDDAGGTPQGAGTTCTALEACCLANGSCVMLDPLCCVDQGGTPQGASSTCTALEACCYADGSCQNLDPLCCVDQGGTPQGAGTICLGDNNGNLIDDACEPDTGACCFDDGSCLVLTAADCANQSGSYKGDGTLCQGDNNANGVDDACESWQPGDGHKMHFPQLPNPYGWDVMATEGQVLADDWQCSETGPVKDIHFWGSWKDGVVGDIQYFVLSIHSDIPADQSPTGYSMPGELLWEHQISQFNTTLLQPGVSEGWYNPATGEQLQNNHSEYYQYDVYLPDSLWFDQVQGTIYWLNIYAVIADPLNTRWGWKSTLDNWNDDAVWTPLGVDQWMELYEPGVGNYVTNQWNVTFDPSGIPIGGYGENAYGEGWYFYPSDWFNVWFYDHPFSYDRFKDVYLEFDAAYVNESMPTFIEVAVNWATDAWSLEQPPEDSMPPLPGVDEGLYIGRQTVLLDEFLQPHYVFQLPIDDYNPEWVSVDVRGYNFDLQNGLIVHNCLPRQQTSLDLAFVITGGELCDCRPGDANGDLVKNITDAVYIITYIFAGGSAPTPYPICSGDANCDCITNITDAVYLIQWIFAGGPAPCDCPTWLTACGPPLR